MGSTAQHMCMQTWFLAANIEAKHSLNTWKAREFHPLLDPLPLSHSTTSGRRFKADKAYVSLPKERATITAERKSPTLILLVAANGHGYQSQLSQFAIPVSRSGALVTKIGAKCLARVRGNIS